MVERTVKEVVPALVNNRDKVLRILSSMPHHNMHLWNIFDTVTSFTSSVPQMGKLIGSLEKQLTEKGEEINGYMEKHQIQVN